MKEKFNGVLLHIGSLPSEYGVGALSRGAFSFVDFLADAKVDFWQTLPLSPTSFGDSPYQSPSAFAGNPYFIDINTLVKRGLLTENEAKRAKTKSLDYAEIFNSRYDVLRCAFKRFQKNSDYSKFLENNEYWLDDFALFMALKVKNGFSSFDTWEKDERRRDTLSDEKIAALQDECDFWRFLQFEFFRELTALKDYAKSKNVALIGDIPIYVAYDSADVWAHPEIFRLDKNMRPKEVAGVPPDYFSADGQLWGNPLYDWKKQQADGFLWWHHRLLHQLQFFDKIRIDHFRAFESYYAVPSGAETAKIGRWVKGVGTKIFDGLDLDDRIIAEDLGIITDKVRRLVKRTGFPGMKVFQFAFDGKSDNEHLPENVRYNTVYYTGTHDNDTLKGWYDALDDGTKEYVKKTLGATDENVFDKTFKRVMRSRAKFVIVPMQDYLLQGSEARMNTPGTNDGNWKYVLPKNYAKVKNRIRKYVKNRCSDSAARTALLKSHYRRR